MYPDYLRGQNKRIIHMRASSVTQCLQADSTNGHDGKRGSLVVVQWFYGQVGATNSGARGLSNPDLRATWALGGTSVYRSVRSFFKMISLNLYSGKVWIFPQPISFGELRSNTMMFFYQEDHQ